MGFIDCFLFYNELDLLEIRLNCLSRYVDKFVLCESPRTLVGDPKPLYFEQNKERFKDFNITHLIVDDDENVEYEDPSDREGHQRDFLMNGFKDADPEQIILVSDVDEIPNLKHYKGGSEGVFRQRLYCYYLNCYTGNYKWKGTIAVKKKNIVTLQALREKIENDRAIYRRIGLKTIVLHGGWHFSSVGTPDQIVSKVEAFRSQRFNNDEFKESIAERKKNLIDPFNRGYRFRFEMPALRWLKRNVRRYRYLFYPPRRR